VCICGGVAGAPLTRHRRTVDAPPLSPRAQRGVCICGTVPAAFAVTLDEERRLHFPGTVPAAKCRFLTSFGMTKGAPRGVGISPAPCHRPNADSSLRSE